MPRYRPAVKLCALATLAIIACKQPASPQLVDLSASLEPVRSEFAAHAHEAQFLTLLAPT